MSGTFLRVGNSSLGKNLVSLLLLVCVIVLWLRIKPELSQTGANPRVSALPSKEPSLFWDGSYPVVTISQVNPAQLKFEHSVVLSGLTVWSTTPISDFGVDLHSGMFILRQTDLYIPEVPPISLTRTYRVWDANSTPFGIGTNHPYDICQTGSKNPYTYMDIQLADGRQIHFPRVSEGTDYTNAVYRHTSTSSEFHGAEISWNGAGWSLHLQDGSKLLFPDSYRSTNCAQRSPLEMRDGQGRVIQLKRDSLGNLQVLVSPTGRTIRFKYDRANRITEALDDSGNVREYDYDFSGHLQTVSNASRVLYRFEYERLIRAPGFDPYLMTVIMDGDWRILLRNTYQDGLVSGQQLANGERYEYHYLFDKTRSSIVETIVTFPNGAKKSFAFEGGLLRRQT